MMDENRAVLRLGAAIVALAVFLRLLGTGALDALTRLPENPELLSALVYLQTGRRVKLPVASVTPPETVPPQTSATVSPEPTLPEQTQALITAEDLNYVSVTYGCDYRPDLESLLLSPLSWNLADGEKRVLILHSHATECYTPVSGENFSLSGTYRTEDPSHNMLSIGDEVARLLEEAGIGVIHDKTLHDSPSFNDAYVNARETIGNYLAEYPSISLVLDLHRDAADTGTGQLVTVGAVDGQRSAQLMLVVGTDGSGKDHPNWQENLSLALKLTAVLEREDPGLCRSINLRSQRFNQDMTPGSLIVEVGAAGNTRAEALLAARALAEGILQLAHGTVS